MAEVTIFESVAAELDERAEGAELAMLIGGDDYTKGVGVAYREAAALVRARALPAMDREGLIECIGEHYDRHGDMAAPNLADAILARFAPPAPAVTAQPAQASEPARVEVGDDVERAFADAFWAGKADDGGEREADNMERKAKALRRQAAAQREIDALMDDIERTGERTQKRGQEVSRG